VQATPLGDSSGTLTPQQATAARSAGRTLGLPEFFGHRAAVFSSSELETAETPHQMAKHQFQRKERSRTGQWQYRPRLQNHSLEKDN